MAVVIGLVPVPVSWTLALDAVFEEVPLPQSSGTQRGASKPSGGLGVAELDNSDFFVFTDRSAVGSGIVHRSSGLLPAGGRSVSQCISFCENWKASLCPPGSVLGWYHRIGYLRGSAIKERLQFLREQIVYPSVYPSSGLYP